MQHSFIKNVALGFRARQAYWQALASGSSVLEVDQWHIVEVFPDGTRKTIKKIDGPIPVTVGYKRKAV